MGYIIIFVVGTEKPIVRHIKIDIFGVEKMVGQVCYNCFVVSVKRGVGWGIWPLLKGWKGGRVG